MKTFLFKKLLFLSAAILFIPAFCLSYSFEDLPGLKYSSTAHSISFFRTKTEHAIFHKNSAGFELRSLKEVSKSDRLKYKSVMGKSAKSPSMEYDARYKGVSCTAFSRSQQLSSYLIHAPPVLL